MSPRWDDPHITARDNKALGFSMLGLMIVLIFVITLYVREWSKPKIVMSPPPCTAQYSGYIYKDAVTAQLNICTSHTTYSYTPILTHAP